MRMFSFSLSLSLSLPLSLSLSLPPYGLPPFPPPRLRGRRLYWLRFGRHAPTPHPAALKGAARDPPHPSPCPFQGVERWGRFFQSKLSQCNLRPLEGHPFA